MTEWRDIARCHEKSRDVLLYTSLTALPGVLCVEAGDLVAARYHKRRDLLVRSFMLLLLLKPKIPLRIGEDSTTRIFGNRTGPYCPEERTFGAMTTGGPRGTAASCGLSVALRSSGLRSELKN